MLQFLHYQKGLAEVTDTTPVCIYCGLRPGSSRDHIPSLGLFSKPAPSNLITVPSCSECNRSFSIDEEYFRAILLYSHYGMQVPEEVWNRNERGLDRERSRLFDLLVDNLQVTETDLLTIEINVAHNRMNTVLVKTLRGLYYHHFGQLLKEGDWSISRVGSIKEMSILAQRWLGTSVFTEIGTSVFAYRFTEISGEDFSSLWQMNFYAMYSCIFAVE